MSNIEVVGLGALNMDYLYKVERILDDGETVINEAISSPGGSAANTIYGLAKLGVNTGFIGTVGDDADGKILLQDFQKVEVDTKQVKRKQGAKTGSVLCFSDRLGKRSLYVSPGANNLLTIDDSDLTYINQAKMLHVSSFVDDRQFKISLELVNKLNSSVKISFSPGELYATKGIRTLTPILARTHVLFANEKEVAQLTGKDFKTGAGVCLKLGCRIIAITLGKGIRLEIGKGVRHRTVTAACYIRDAKNECAVESTSQNIVSEVDTTGAGDAFATGFLYGLLKEKGLEECGRLGDIVARFCITELGTRQGLPTFNRLSQRYRELYSQQL